MRAGRLIERFGTVEATITESPENLAEVEGLGPTLARKIRWSVSEPLGRYTQK